MDVGTNSNGKNPMTPHLCRVVKRYQENDDTFTLYLNPVAESPFTNGFGAGQFDMLYVYGVGEIPISISGDPSHPEQLVHTTRAVGTVTRAMDKVRVGDMLAVRGPYGSEWPVDDAVNHDVVLVAGGIGLAPLRPALYRMLNERSNYGKIVLLYGARTQEDMLYRPELEQWRARFDLDIYVTVDRATGDWYGNVGVVTGLIPRAPFDARNAIAMICGPEVMMRYTVQALQKRGVADDKIYLSLERNMKCGTGICGHCQYGSLFICKDGPVFSYDQVRRFFGKWEV
jgi:NAD(P)H-flavin reductase